MLEVFASTPPAIVQEAAKLGLVVQGRTQVQAVEVGGGSEPWAVNKESL